MKSRPLPAPGIQRHSRLARGCSRDEAIPAVRNVAAVKGPAALAATPCAASGATRAYVSPLANSIGGSTRNDIGRAYDTQRGGPGRSAGLLAANRQLQLAQHARRTKRRLRESLTPI